jgi:hypothetical protein
MNYFWWISLCILSCIAEVDGRHSRRGLGPHARDRYAATLKARAADVRTRQVGVTLGANMDGKLNSFGNPHHIRKQLPPIFKNKGFTLGNKLNNVRTHFH